MSVAVAVMGWVQTALEVQLLFCFVGSEMNTLLVLAQNVFPRTSE